MKKKMKNTQKLFFEKKRTSSSPPFFSEVYLQVKLLDLFPAPPEDGEKTWAHRVQEI